MDFKFENGYEIRIRWANCNETHICLVKDDVCIASKILREDDECEKAYIASSFVKFTDYEVTVKGPEPKKGCWYMARKLKSNRALIRYNGPDEPVTDTYNNELGMIKDYQLLEEWGPKE